MGRKKVKEAADNESVTGNDSFEPNEPVSKPGRSKEKIPGSFAPFVFLVSLLVCVTLIYSFFYRPISSQVIDLEPSKSLKVNLDITSLEFATEGSASGSIDVCKGTKSFQGINNARVQILTLQGKEISSIAIEDAYSKIGTTCKYKMELAEVPSFSGSKLRVFVRFPFGDSGTFTVEVGDKIPYRAVNIRLTLG